MTQWNRSPWTEAAQIQTLLDPDRDYPEASGKPLDEWYRQLVGSGQHAEAVFFLALALPRYECVAWAAQSLLEVGAVDRRDPLMVAVLRWIDSPDEGLRRAAETEADRARRQTPARLLALAVQFSGGSLAPAEYQAVQPPPDVCGRMAGGAIIMAVYAMTDPAKAMTRVLEIGERMVEGA